MTSCFRSSAVMTRPLWRGRGFRDPAPDPARVRGQRSSVRETKLLLCSFPQTDPPIWPQRGGSKGQKVPRQQDVRGNWKRVRDHNAASDAAVSFLLTLRSQTHTHTHTHTHTYSWQKMRAALMEPLLEDTELCSTSPSR